MLFLFTVPFIVALTGSIVAAITDVRHFKVFNRLTFPLLVSGVVYHVSLGVLGVGGLAGLRYSVWGLVLPLLVLLPVYAFGAMGAGDVKFASAVGAWLGAELIVPVLVVGALCSGLYSISLIVCAGGANDAWRNFQMLLFHLTQIWDRGSLASKIETVQAATHRVDRRRRLIPFSAMNAVGVLLTFVWYASHGVAL